MTSAEIRAYLRGGTHGKLLRGWYFYGPADALRWVVAPRDGACGDYSHDEAVSYCRMLRAAGVAPAVPAHGSARALGRL